MARWSKAENVPAGFLSISAYLGLIHQQMESRLRTEDQQQLPATVATQDLLHLSNSVSVSMELDPPQAPLSNIDNLSAAAVGMSDTAKVSITVRVLHCMTGLTAIENVSAQPERAWWFTNGAL
jgi:hypothetical protein